MRQRLTESYVFSALIEGMITEASAVLTKLGPNISKDLKDVVLALHQNRVLPHNASNMGSVDRVSWNDIKGDYITGAQVPARSRKGGAGKLVLVQFQKGAAAFYSASGYNYRCFIKEPDQDVYATTTTSINGFFNNIKSKIGKPTQFYVVRTQAAVKKHPYDNTTSEPDNGMGTISGLLSKITPLIMKQGQKAKADIKGVVVEMIKNDVPFDKIEKKMRKLKTIDNYLNEFTNNPEPLVREIFAYGIAQTIGHFNPNIDITRNSVSFRNLENGWYEIGREGSKLAQEIGRGDQTKLAALLYYIRRAWLML